MAHLAAECHLFLSNLQKPSAILAGITIFIGETQAENRPNTEASQMVKLIGFTASMVLLFALLRQTWRAEQGNARRRALLAPRG